MSPKLQLHCQRESSQGDCIDSHSLCEFLCIRNVPPYLDLCDVVLITFVCQPASYKTWKQLLALASPNHLLYNFIKPLEVRHSVAPHFWVIVISNDLHIPPTSSYTVEAKYALHFKTPSEPLDDYMTTYTGHHHVNFQWCWRSFEVERPNCILSLLHHVLLQMSGWPCVGLMSHVRVIAVTVCMRLGDCGGSKLHAW